MKNDTKQGAALVAWLEDDDPLRQEILTGMLIRVPEVPLYMASDVPSLWEGLRKHTIRIIFIDVMLASICRVKRLSEGVALGQWIHSCALPAEYARTFELEAKIPGRYKDVPLVFATGRATDRLEVELKEVGLEGCPILAKADEDTNLLDVAADLIKSTICKAPTRNPGG